jgi:hypothetical protein
MVMIPVITQPPETDKRTALGHRQPRKPSDTNQYDILGNRQTHNPRKLANTQPSGIHPGLGTGRRRTLGNWQTSQTTNASNYGLILVRTHPKTDSSWDFVRTHPGTDSSKNKLILMQTHPKPDSATTELAESEPNSPTLALVRSELASSDLASSDFGESCFWRYTREATLHSPWHPSPISPTAVSVQTTA